MFRRRRPIVRQFLRSELADWPPSPPPIVPMGGDLRSMRGILLGLAFGVGFWALLMIPAWWWGIL